MKLFALAASSREGSVNQKLLAHATKVAAAEGAEITFLDYDSIASIPAYNDALSEAQGQPDGAQLFVDALNNHDGFIISLPEYNWSYPGSLKNVVDWASRVRPMPYGGKKALLMSASPSLHGGVKAVLHFRQPLEALGTAVHPNVITVSDAYNAFAEDGSFVNETIHANMARTVKAFIASF